MHDIANEQLLTVQDAARLLRVKPATVRSHIARGLEAIRIGKLIYTSREAIKRFAQPIEAGRVTATQMRRERRYMRQLGMKT